MKLNSSSVRERKYSGVQNETTNKIGRKVANIVTGFLKNDRENNLFWHARKYLQ
jgi:hypothetical protein